MMKKDEKKSLEILSLQETERRRIAEDLHDTTVQELVALSQQLELANLYFDKDIVQARLELNSARTHIKSIISGIRETIYDLRPMTFDDIGWNASIERIYNEVKSRNDINVIFDIDKISNIDKVTEITLYRIIKEGVNNVCRHAKASNLEVSLHVVNNHIVLKINDNGIGIIEQANDNHFGMQLMKEKVKLLNGDIRIKSGDNGTKITVTIPYNK